jgi:hypothetical protein
VKLKIINCIFFVQEPPVGQGLHIREDSRSHTTTHQQYQQRVAAVTRRTAPSTHTALQTEAHIATAQQQF